MNKLWICGQLKGDWAETGSVWEFQGVFSTEEKACNACRNENYFIFPSELDKELPDKSTISDDAYYPLLESCDITTEGNKMKEPYEDKNGGCLCSAYCDCECVCGAWDNQKRQ